VKTSQTLCLLTLQVGWAYPAIPRLIPPEKFVNPVYTIPPGACRKQRQLPLIPFAPRTRHVTFSSQRQLRIRLSATSIEYVHLTRDELTAWYHGTHFSQFLISLKSCLVPAGLVWRERDIPSPRRLHLYLPPSAVAASRPHQSVLPGSTSVRAAAAWVWHDDSRPTSKFSLTLCTPKCQQGIWHHR
jgi:hypothetical protein